MEDNTEQLRQTYVGPVGGAVGPRDITSQPAVASYADQPGSDRRWDHAPRAWRGPGYDEVGWWPILLIALGVMFLLGNFGFLGWDIWGQIWRLWPLVLIAVGLTILFRPRTRTMPILVLVSVIALLLVVAMMSTVGVFLPPLILVGALAVFGLIAWSLYSGGNWRTGNVLKVPLNVPLGEARAADTRIDFGAGELVVDATSEPSLAIGSLDYYEGWGQPVVEVLSSPTTRLHLSQGSYRGRGFGSGVFNLDRPIRWFVNLNQGLPLTLHVKLGASKTTLNLERLLVTDLRLEAGANDTTVIFPAGTEYTHAAVSGGAANFKLLVPRNVTARIKTKAGLASVNIDPSIRRLRDGEPEPPNTLDLLVEVGVANVEIRAL